MTLPEKGAAVGLIGKGWLKTLKVAKYLDCTKSQVYDLVHDGELQAFKHGQTLRISVESLEAFVERHRVEATEAFVERHRVEATEAGEPGPPE
jgi:excisionase family DNA binding protein